MKKKKGIQLGWVPGLIQPVIGMEAMKPPIKVINSMT